MVDAYLDRTYDTERHGVRSLTWSPDGSALLAVSGNGTAWLWDDATGDTRWRVKPGISPACLAWSPDGRYLLARDDHWSEDRTSTGARLLGALEGTSLMTYRAQSRKLVGVTWTPDGESVLGVTSDGSFARWEMYSGHLLGLLEVSPFGGLNLGVASTPNYELVAIASATGRVECRWVADWRLAWAVSGGQVGSASAVTWAGDGAMVARAAEGGISAWSHEDALTTWAARADHGDAWRDPFEAPQPGHELGRLPRGARAVGLSFDGTFLGGRTHDGELFLWRLDETGEWAKTPRVIATCSGCSAQLAFHPRRARLALVTGDGSTVEVWNLEGGETKPFHGERGPSTAQPA